MRAYKDLGDEGDYQDEDLLDVSIGNRRPPPTVRSQQSAPVGTGAGPPNFPNPFAWEPVDPDFRHIYVNESSRNALQRPSFAKNIIVTAKYNLVTFLPKFLFEQFSKFANTFFLFIACIQQIPGVSPTSPYTTILPLVIVLSASCIKEVLEDTKRHRMDHERTPKVFIFGFL